MNSVVPFLYLAVLVTVGQCLQREEFRSLLVGPSQGRMFRSDAPFVRNNGPLMGIDSPPVGPGRPVMKSNSLRVARSPKDDLVTDESYGFGYGYYPGYFGGYHGGYHGGYYGGYYPYDGFYGYPYYGYGYGYGYGYPYHYGGFYGDSLGYFY